MKKEENFTLSQTPIRDTLVVKISKGKKTRTLKKDIDYKIKGKRLTLYNETRKTPQKRPRTLKYKNPQVRMRVWTMVQRKEMPTL